MARNAGDKISKRTRESDQLMPYLKKFNVAKKSFERKF